MADPVYFLYATATALVVLIIGLEEIPWEFNIARVARRVRRTASRKTIPMPAALEGIRRQTRLGGLVLGGFGMASMVLVLYGFGRGGDDADVTLLKTTLAGGLLFLSAMFVFVAPRLFNAVETRIVVESATTNSQAPNAEGPHGPGP